MAWLSAMGPHEVMLQDSNTAGAPICLAQQSARVCTSPSTSHFDFEGDRALNPITLNPKPSTPKTLRRGFPVQVKPLHDCTLPTRDAAASPGHRMQQPRARACQMPTCTRAVPVLQCPSASTSQQPESRRGSREFKDRGQASSAPRTHTGNAGATAHPATLAPINEISARKPSS